MLTRRPVIALVAAMVLWAPTLKNFLGGAIDVTPLAMRFVVAFSLAYLGVTLLGLVTAGYGRSQPAPAPARRHTDPSDEPNPANHRANSLQ